MTVLRTTVGLRKADVRRLLRRGYELRYIETRHLDAGDETTIVWTRSARSDDIPEHQVPY
jgi:hypothetical protein